MRNAKDEPIPHAELRTISPIQNGLLFPVLESMIRRIRARTEHLARLKVIKQRIRAARTDFEDIAHCSGVVMELNLPRPLFKLTNIAMA